MSGFTGVASPGGKIPLSSVIAGGEDGKMARRGDVRIAEKFLDKFADDKCFSDRGNYFVCLDGVTLNSRELVRSFAATDIGSAVAEMAAKDPSGFPAALRGDFGGFVWDLAENKGVLFTNHFGSRYLYYAYDEPTGATFFSSSLADMAAMLRSAGKATRLDETAGYYMLSFGYMADDRTLVEGVRKLEPGRCLQIAAGHAPQVRRYFAYDNENLLDENFDGIVDGLYERMSLAVRQGFEKDREYGFHHLSLLSGGLDSRMILFFARKLGFSDILTLTFGQSGCADEKIAAAISRDLGCDHLFRQLDGGNFLATSIDDCVEANDGMIIYAGSAHALSSYRMIDWRRYGLLHNGNLADVSQGDYVETDAHVPPSSEEWAYSKRFLPHVRETIGAVLSRYPNQEAFAIATRGSNAILNGSLSAQGLTETDEPFLHPDLASWAARIPPRYKKGEHAFLAMINKYFPEAAAYPWQRWRLNPTLANMERLKTPAFRFVHRGRKAIGYAVDGILERPSRHDMNPINYWYKNNPELRAEFKRRRDSMGDALSGHGDLAEDCVRLFDEGSELEKAQAITLAVAAERLGLA